MRNNFFSRKRAEADNAAGKISVDHRQRLIVFRYKGEQYKYCFESSTGHGFAYIYDHPYSRDGKCIYSTMSKEQTTDLGREIYDALVKQKITTDGGS